MSRILTALPFAAVCLPFVLLFVFPDEAAQAAAEAMKLCAGKVVPALFPFLTLSSVILSLDLFHPLETLFPAKAFGLPECAGSAILLGLVCGFPVGAASAARLVKDGRITRSDAARITALFSGASPAFLIGTVGSLWKSRSFGAFLYGMQVLTALLTGFFTRGRLVRSGVRSEKTVAAAKTAPAETAQHPRESLGTVLRRSIPAAAQTCLNVTAYVTFFRIAAALVSCLTPGWGPVIAAVFEFSSGCAAGASLGGTAGAFLTGFSAGLGGLSVFLQITAHTEPEEIPFLPTAGAMLVRGAVMGLAGILFFAIPGNNFIQRA